MSNTFNKSKRFLSRHALFAVCGLAVFLLLILALAAKGGKYRVNTTDSMPKGVYCLSPGSPAKGDFVMFCLEGEYAELARERGYVKPGSCPSGLRPLVKILAGVPGDAVDTKKLSYCLIDSQGRKVPASLESGIIPEGFALVMTEHPGSFDGRYFGLVPFDALVKVEPVFLFDTEGGQQ